MLISQSRVCGAFKCAFTSNGSCPVSSDDTTLILDGTQESLKRSFTILEKFGEVSGLRVNCEKTEALWIGSKKGSNQILCSDKNLKWSDGKVKAIGAWVCIDCEESKKKNYEEKVNKVEDILNNWRNTRLTLIGKIAVIKALAASQLVYCFVIIDVMFKITERNKQSSF